LHFVKFCHGEFILTAISVITCTIDRPLLLAATLAALSDLDLSGVTEFESVVVNNGSVAAVAAVIDRFAASAPFRVRSVSEPRAGATRALNAGVRASTGALLLFIDDDCIASPDLIQAMLRLFEDGLGKLIGGRIELHDAADLPICIKTEREPDVAHSFQQILHIAYSANMALGREVYDRIGGFDVRFGPGSALKGADDLDFVYRAFTAGVPVSYEPDMVVYHNHGRKCPLVARRLLRGYNRGHGAMAAKFALAGRLDVARLVYWQLISAIRRFCRRQSAMSEILTELMVVSGAVQFILTQSWRPHS
jgi:GT2 family glycosyltransferase